MILHAFIILSLMLKENINGNIFDIPPLAELDFLRTIFREDHVSFHLYHYDLAADDRLIINDPQSIVNSKFNSQLPTKIIIHGWTHHRNVPWLIDMRQAMALTGQWNIIVVDWSHLSHHIYMEARHHTPLVSHQVARMVLTILRAQEVLLSSIHIIGHSMGAQIAAFTAFKLQQVVNDKVGRITGLDPAAPLYEWPQDDFLDEILDPTDAHFVDVIHTNAKYLGVIGPNGHVDYYPNGGVQQPGCLTWVCSHLKAVEYWTASIRNPYLFHAYPYSNRWNDYNTMQDSIQVNCLESYPMGILANSESIPPGSYYVEV